jgi:hypothetical protein
VAGVGSWEMRWQLHAVNYTRQRRNECRDDFPTPFSKCSTLNFVLCEVWIYNGYIGY